MLESNNLEHLLECIVVKVTLNIQSRRHGSRKDERICNSSLVLGTFYSKIGTCGITCTAGGRVANLMEVMSARYL